VYMEFTLDTRLPQYIVWKSSVFWYRLAPLHVCWVSRNLCHMVVSSLVSI
jgi:hypothetical protein